MLCALSLSLMRKRTIEKGPPVSTPDGQAWARRWRKERFYTQVTIRQKVQGANNPSHCRFVIGLRGDFEERARPAVLV